MGPPTAVAPVRPEGLPKPRSSRVESVALVEERAALLAPRRGEVQRVERAEVQEPLGWRNEGG